MKTIQIPRFLFIFFLFVTGCGAPHSLDNSGNDVEQRRGSRPDRNGRPGEVTGGLTLSSTGVRVGTSSSTPVNCTASGVDIVGAIEAAAGVMARMCERQNELLASNGYTRCPTQMCFYESTSTDPDNAVLEIGVTYTDNLGSNTSSSSSRSSGSSFGSSRTDPRRLTIDLDLTIPLGGPRTSTKCLSPIHPDIFSEIQAKTIEEVTSRATC